MTTPTDQSAPLPMPRPAPLSGLTGLAPRHALTMAQIDSRCVETPEDVALVRAGIAEHFDLEFEMELAREQRRRKVVKEADAREGGAAAGPVEPIDWVELFALEEEDEEWIIPPLLAARRQVALYSAPKVGKSLLLLEIAVGVASGGVVLGQRVDRPRPVVYVDFENDPRGDIRSRLRAMGIGPADLNRLHYYSFPQVEKFDTAAGGAALLELVEKHDAELVVIDTVSRTITGDENENDTWLRFYNHTGQRLKARGTALIRLDHSGKDVTKGQRGGSAKSGDVDAVWRLDKRTDSKDGLVLSCEASRMLVPDNRLVLTRLSNPLGHRVDGAAARELDTIATWAELLDRADVPVDWGRDKARKALEDAGHSGVSNAVLSSAIKARRDG